MRSPPPVPRLREELRAKRVGERVVIEDPIRRVRIPIDPLALEVVQALADRAVHPDQLAAMIAAPRVEIRDRVAYLNRHNLLETPRAADQLAVHRAPPPAPATTLRFHPTLAHGCVSCGGCCTATDVGPLSDADVARVQAIDWRVHLPDVSPAEWIDEIPAEQSPTRAPLKLMGMRHGRCVFLGDDQLCVIHKHHGAQQKPRLCRQFPFAFTQTPGGIDVSFSTECRAWWKARNHAPPPEHDGIQREQIAALIAEGAPLHAVPLPLTLTDGHDVDFPTWEAIRVDMLKGVAAAGSIAALVQALIDPVRDHLDHATSRYRESELFASRAAFAVPEPDPGDQTARFFAALADTRTVLSAGVSAIASGQGEDDDGDRSRRFLSGLEAVLTGRDVSGPQPFLHALEVWRDLASASVQSHEPARKNDVVLGVAVLVMKLLVAPTLAALSTRAALRARTSEHEVVDAMVLATKVPRGTAFERLFVAQRRALVTTFFVDAPTLAAGVAPRALPIWL